VLKIGIIGLGDIAQKAYLPVISKKNVEVHLFSRNEATLSQVSKLYRFEHVHQSLDSLIKSGIKGAFVHSSTSSHFSIVEQLLLNNIHVFVDKPLTYEFTSSEKLIILADKKNLILFVGFNRRYAPLYVQLKTLQEVNMIIMQKNRNRLPDDVRKFVFDDFIHVIDTLLFLFPYSIDKINVTGKKEGNMLYHVIVQFVAANGATAIGIMNRDSGTVEERLEVFSPASKNVVYNMSEFVVLQDKSETKFGSDDWAPTLYKRGFEQIVDEFLRNVEAGVPTKSIYEQNLLTHKICEDVVTKLSET